MASLHRSIQRLGVRRQRHILGVGRSLLATSRFVQAGWGPAGATFVLVGLAAMCGDLLIASWRQAPAVLSALNLLTIAGASAGLVATWGRVSQQALTASVPEPRRLATAVEHELAVAGSPRAEIERLEITATRGLWVRGAERSWLLLDCAHEGWVVLSSQDGGDALPPARQRWTIERLRFTHAIVSVLSRGDPLRTTQLELAAEALAALSPCEVMTRMELPIAVQGALGTVAGGYRS